MFVLSDKTAERLKRLLGDTGIAEPPQSPRAQGARTVLVRCTSATAAGADGAGALCYPAVVLSPAADDATEPEELGTVWLTVWGTAGAETPTVDQVYVCKLSGELEIEDDIRCRAHAGAAAVNSGSQGFGDYTITTDNAWETVTDSTETLSPGTYLLFAPLSAWAKTSAGFGAIHVRFYNATAGSYVGGYYGLAAATTQVINQNVFGSATLIALVTLSTSSDIRIEATRTASGTTWVTSLIRMWAAATGTHYWYWVKL